jgi:hypothetical protein
MATVNGDLAFAPQIPHLIRRVEEPSEFNIRPLMTFTFSVDDDGDMHLKPVQPMDPATRLRSQCTRGRGSAELTKRSRSYEVARQPDCNVADQQLVYQSLPGVLRSGHARGGGV